MFQIGTIIPSKLVSQLPYWDFPSYRDFDFITDFTKNGFKSQSIYNGNLATLITDSHSGSIEVESSNGWSSVAANGLCRSDLGLQTVPTRTNLIRNNSMIGAVPGTPGVGPTNWAYDNVAGLTRTMIGNGTENGLPFIDFQFVSDGSHTGTFSNVRFEQPTQIVATNGQTWTASFGYKILSGNFTNITPQISIFERTIGGVFVTSHSTNLTQSSSFTFGKATYALNGGGTVARLDCALSLQLIPGSVINLTIRIYAPQLELSSYATPPILTSVTAVTRTGNVQKFTLPTAAQSGIGIVLKTDIRGINANDLPVILGINPTSQIAQSLMDVANDLGSITSGIKTIIMAASPGYIKTRILGGTDIASGSGDYDTNITNLSLGGNGFDAQNNIYAMHKFLGLKYGIQNDTTFAALYALAGIVAA